MSQEIIKTSTNHIFIRHLKNIVTFVGVLVVDIHLGGLLVNDRKALMFNSLLFFSRSVVQYRYQILNVDKANADSGLTDSGHSPSGHISLGILRNYNVM